MATFYARLDHLPAQRRELVRLRGPDVVRFLQGTLTANVESLAPGEARAAALLTVKGKLVTELLMLHVEDDGLDLLVPESEAENLASLLDRHIIMDEVTVERLGPVATAVAWSEDGSQPQLPDTDVRVYRCRHPAPGLLVIGIDGRVTHVLREAREMDADGWAAHRTATASPAWGAELTPGHFPPEIGFTYAVDYDKGCYLGQEPLARLHARGQTQRVMVRVEADAAPSGPVDLDHAEREGAGRWTTIVGATPVRGLAIVRRSFAEPGVTLQTADEARLPVRVISGPLGDDPGVERSKPATVQLGRRGA